MTYTPQAPQEQAEVTPCLASCPSLSCPRPSQPQPCPLIHFFWEHISNKSLAMNPHLRFCFWGIQPKTPRTASPSHALLKDAVATPAALPRRPMHDGLLCAQRTPGRYRRGGRCPRTKQVKKTATRCSEAQRLKNDATILRNGFTPDSPTDLLCDPRPASV